MIQGVRRKTLVQILSKVSMKPNGEKENRKTLEMARFLLHFSMVSTNSQQDLTLLEGLKPNNLNSYLNLSSNNFPNNHKHLGSKGSLNSLPGRSLHPLQAQILGTIFKQ